MAAVAESLATRPAPRPAPRPAEPKAGPVTLPWIRAQGINVNRHAAALRPFKTGEFGTGAAAPSDGHLLAVNQLITRLRSELLQRTRLTSEAAARAAAGPDPQHLTAMLVGKERSHQMVRAIEKVWNFYFELFGQRQTRVADWLLSCDRIALDCYQVVYMGLGRAKSIPAPPPFSYMATGFSPATYRRGIAFSKLGKQLNPFPLVELPYHRLTNPWTLGAVLHEVSHNIQSDVGLARAVPRQIALRMLRAGLPKQVAQTWTRWNRETFADLSGVLMGGPAVVGSLMDVVGRSPATVLGWSPTGVHPNPYIRPLISIELLRRMGFQERAKRYLSLWRRLYPDPSKGLIPAPMLATLPKALGLAVDAICYSAYAELGGKALAEVISFGAKEEQMMQEAARRLAAGTDPGIIPARFLIGASRIALNQRLARPGQIAKAFYRELARR
jgi:hypothetical protein